MEEVKIKIIKESEVDINEAVWYLFGFLAGVGEAKTSKSILKKGLSIIE